MTATWNVTRDEFLNMILQDALRGASYWAKVQTWNETATGDVVVITDAEDNDKTHTVTTATIAAGITKLINSECNYTHHTYDANAVYGPTPERIALFDRTNGADSDTDAQDYDAMLQAGIFGEVIYG